MKTLNDSLVGDIVILLISIFFTLIVFSETSYANNPLVTEAQKRLHEEGYDPGPVDGFLGNKTISAIKAFQKKNGLSVTGAIDKRTAEMLQIKSGSINVTPSHRPSSSNSRIVKMSLQGDRIVASGFPSLIYPHDKAGKVVHSGMFSYE